MRFGSRYFCAPFRKILRLYRSLPTLRNLSDCFCIRTDTTICNPVFLAMRLACSSTFVALEEEIHGATRPRINLRQLKEFTFDLLSVNEQHEVAHRVQALFAYADRLEARYKIARAQVERLTPALLAKAFRGELVPQDPNDEPASVLLERIRNEKENYRKKK
jgi:type I restriction enzyme S subunit